MSFRGVQRSEQRVPQRILIRTPGNRYDFDRSRIPPGMDYGWKRKSFMGFEDIEHMVNLEANGWTPVPPERHPELTGSRLQKGAEIVRGGLMLMERPAEISEDARELDGAFARQQVADHMKRLGLAGHRASGHGLKTHYERPPDVNVVDDGL